MSRILQKPSEPPKQLPLIQSPSDWGVSILQTLNQDYPTDPFIQDDGCGVFRHYQMWKPDKIIVLQYTFIPEIARFLDSSKQLESIGAYCLARRDLLPLMKTEGFQTALIDPYALGETITLLVHLHHPNLFPIKGEYTPSGSHLYIP